MIEKIKVLIGDDVNDVLIDIYIDRAIMSIISYLNNSRLTKDHIREQNEEAIIAIVENLHSTRDYKNIKSMSQGKRSVTYRDESLEIITPEISKLLPVPYAKLL